SSRQIAVVGDDGRYAIDHVGAGRVRVALFKQVGRRMASAAMQDVDVDEGGEATADFVWREVLVSGRVTTSDGAPLAGANVRFTGHGGSSVSYGGGGDRPGPLPYTGTTDADGAY